MEIMGVQQCGTVYLSILQKGIYMDFSMMVTIIWGFNMIQVLSPQNNNTTNEHGDFS
jgi:hypothetical protein